MLKQSGTYSNHYALQGFNRHTDSSTPALYSFNIQGESVTVSTSSYGFPDNPSLTLPLHITALTGHSGIAILPNIHAMNLSAI